MSSQDAPKPPGWADSVFAAEAAAAAEQARLVEESRANISNKCPDCGALGSLEPFGDSGELKCVDCDVTVANVSRLGGLGRN